MLIDDLVAVVNELLDSDAGVNEIVVFELVLARASGGVVVARVAVGIFLGAVVGMGNDGERVNMDDIGH